MSLLTDARVCNNHANLAKDKIEVKVLSEVEKDLEPYEKISILFLITPLEFLKQAYQKIMELLEKNDESMLVKWIEDFQIQEWEEKLLEALLIIKNFQIVKKLGFSKEEQILFSERFQIPQAEVSPNLNRVLKTLYFLCEELNAEETKSLITTFKTQANNREELELFLLFLIEKGFISVSGETGNLGNLLERLKQISYSKDNIVYIALEHLNYEEDIQRNVQDSQQSWGNSLLMVVNENGNPRPENNIKNNISSIHNEIYDCDKGLCIIINQERFDRNKGKHYDRRKGSKVDVDKLTSTFTKFGMKIEVKENLTKSEFLNELEVIGNHTKQEYDCIVLCILSHGKEKSFVSRDCEDISFEQIENGMCTPQMKEVVKILIVQACQGDLLGKLVDDGSLEVESSQNGELTCDGPTQRKEPSVYDNRRFNDFVMFIATIGKYKSIRNEITGTWFIQTLCDVLEEYDEIFWHDFVLYVKRLVSQMKGKLKDDENVVQVAETTNDRLQKKFIFRKKGGITEWKKLLKEIPAN